MASLREEGVDGKSYTAGVILAVMLFSAVVAAWIPATIVSPCVAVIEPAEDDTSAVTAVCTLDAAVERSVSAVSMSEKAAMLCCLWR